MGRLTDRIRARNEARAEAERALEVDRVYQQVLERIADLEDPQQGLRLGAFYRIAEEHEYPVEPGPALGRRPGEWDWPGQVEGTGVRSDPVAQIRREAEADRRLNVLYQLWMEQRLTRGPVDLELEEYSEPVAGRALVRLLALVPHGAGLLSSVSDDPDPSWIPRKDDMRRFMDGGGMAETDDQVFLSRLFAEVPGSRRALYRLLGAYKLVIRLQADRDGEPVQGELPGEDYGTELVTWDQLTRLLGAPPTSFERAYAQEGAMARAVTRYLAGDGLDQAAREHGIPRARLRQHLDDEKLLRPRGRPRRSFHHRPVPEKGIGRDDG